MIKIQYLGQNGFKIDFQGVNLCFDLYLSNSVYELTGNGIRNYEPPVTCDDLAKLDYCFISHNHLDHLDPATIKMLCENSDATFVCPAPYIEILEELGIKRDRIVGAKANEKLNFENFYVVPIPEKHEEYTVINGEHGNLGYVICAKKFRFFHAGDVIADKTLAETLKKFSPYDVMFLPINGHDWIRYSSNIMGNMNYREALDLCDYVGTNLVVPMHYDLFDNNTENPAYFVDYLYKKYPFQKFKMFMPGEIIFLRGDCGNDKD